MQKLPILKSKGTWRRGKKKKMNEQRYRNPKVVNELDIEKDEYCIVAPISKRK